MAKRSTSVLTRRTLSAAAAVAAIAVLAGCSATNPITTSFDYDPSDGVSQRLGDVRVGNLLLLTAEEGGAGTFVGFVANGGGQPAAVVIALGGDETVDVEAVPAAPGSKVDVTVTTDVSGAATVQVPVLDGTLPEYADLLP